MSRTIVVAAAWVRRCFSRRTGEGRGDHSSWQAAVLERVPSAIDYLATSVLSPNEVDDLLQRIEMVSGRLPKIGRLL